MAASNYSRASVKWRHGEMIISGENHRIALVTIGGRRSAAKGMAA